MKLVNKTTPYYDDALEAAEYVKAGETVRFDAPDCWGNRLTADITKGDLYAMGLEMNPCCGPVWVEDAMPGDTLKITVEDIQVKDGHLAVYREEFGVLGSYLDRDETVKVPIADGTALLHGGKFRLPIRPMLGVLAVTPPGERQSTLLSGTYGGNMDCNLIGKGAVVYLPVQVPGAKVITGDVHALQGDGEVLASLETPAEITLKIELIKGRAEQWPVLETEDAWYVITSALTSSDANTLALSAMADFLTGRKQYSSLEWLTLMGLVGNAQNCKVVDTFKTSRFMMPKSVTGDLSF